MRFPLSSTALSSSHTLSHVPVSLFCSEVEGVDTASPRARDRVRAGERGGSRSRSASAAAVAAAAAAAAAAADDDDDDTGGIDDVDGGLEATGVVSAESAAPEDCDEAGGTGERSYLSDLAALSLGDKNALDDT